MPSSIATSPQCVLAFDTSTERLCAGLATPQGEFTVNVAGGAGASIALLPQLRGLLQRACHGWTNVDAIAFGAGPGAFTGLRTSCAVAQGLALGLGLPLLALDSLLVVAEDARLQAASDAVTFDVAVAMDARMDEVYAARYRWHSAGPAGRWQVLDAPALRTLADWARAWTATAPDALAGSALAAFGGRVELPQARRIDAPTDRAAALLRLALAAAADGAAVDAAAAAALPVYLRDRIAATTAERAAARSATGAGAAPLR